MSARCTISVLAVGTSMPDSTMVVESSTSNLPVIEGVHDVIKLPGGHLAMGDRNLHLGHLLFKELMHLGDVGDARADIEALAAAIALAQQGLADRERVEGRNEGPDGKAVKRVGWR